MPETNDHAQRAIRTKQDDVKRREEVARVLEEARQKVKPLVKREAEGEVVTAELLGVRLKAESK